MLQAAKFWTERLSWWLELSRLQCERSELCQYISPKSLRLKQFQVVLVWLVSKHGIVQRSRLSVRVSDVYIPGNLAYLNIRVLTCT